jgi:hypothetical protein
VQRPRIPVWAAAFPHNLKPLRRAARYDGFFPVNLEGVDEFAQAVATVREAGMTLRHSHQCCGKPCRRRTVVASGFPASATCIRRPVESVTKAWVTPGSSGISVGASGVSVTTPFS